MCENIYNKKLKIILFNKQYQIKYIMPVPNQHYHNIIPYFNIILLPNVPPIIPFQRIRMIPINQKFPISKEHKENSKLIKKLSDGNKMDMVD